MPTIEVRFEHLVASAEVRVGDSGLPTVLNSITNTLEVRLIATPGAQISRSCFFFRKRPDLDLLKKRPALVCLCVSAWKRDLFVFGCLVQEAANALRILPNRKRTMPILHDVSGIIKPRR